MMILSLPYPPSANNLHSVFKGRKILSAAGRAYYDEVTLTVGAQLKVQGAKRFDAADRLTYTLTVFPPDRRRRDLSNVVKAFEDSLTKAGIWADDSQVDDYRVRRSAVFKGGRLIADVQRIEIGNP